MTFPIIHNIEKITFPKPDTFHYKNGITAYGFNGVKNDILRIEILFDAGRWTEQFPLQAEFAARLIKSGTTHLSAFEIEEKIDSFGSTVKCDAGNNTVTVSVFCMNKYLDQTLEVVFDCLNNCTYQKHEIDIFKSRKIAVCWLRRKKMITSLMCYSEKQSLVKRIHMVTKQRKKLLKLLHKIIYWNTLIRI